MKKKVLISLALVCVLAVMIVGCTNTPPAPVPTPTPQIVYITVIVTPTPAPTTIATPAPDQRPGTLSVTAQAFTGTATLNLDGNDAGSLTQSTPFSVQLPQGSHTLKVCVGPACDLEVVQINATKVTYLDLSAKIADLAANEKPSVKIIDTTPAANQILVTLQFVNPTTEDLTMTAVVVCNYQYNGGKFGSGTASGSGIAKADVGSGGRVLTIATIALSNDIGTVYVGGAPTISSFQYASVVQK